MTNSFQPHGLQHARLLCLSIYPRVCSNSCPLNRWCYLPILSFAAPFPFDLQSFPASGSVPMSWLFTSGGQSIGASTSASGFPMNIQYWFPLGLTGLVSLQSKGLPRVFSSTTVHTVHGVLEARILKWFAILFSSGPCSVRTLHHDPSILSGPTWHSS